MIFKHFSYYYDERKENDYIGIIDKSTIDDVDVFKLRKKEIEMKLKKEELVFLLLKVRYVALLRIKIN